MTALELNKIQHEIIKAINKVCNWTQYMDVNSESDLHHDLMMNRIDIRKVIFELQFKYNVKVQDNCDVFVETVGDIETIVKKKISMSCRE